MKMSRLTQLLLIFSIFSFASCSKEDAAPCETLENIVGTWRSYSMTRTFTYNYEVIDSIFHNENIAYVKKGKFRFSDGFIEFIDMKFIYLDDMKGSMFIYSSPLYKYKIINNDLFLEPTDILYPIEHNGHSINGKWSASRIITIHEEGKVPQFISGIQNIEFEFNQESNTYFIHFADHLRDTIDRYSHGPYNFNYNVPLVYFGTDEFPGGEIKNGVLVLSSTEEEFSKQ